MSAVSKVEQDGVYYITFNRPEKKNAFNYELLDDLYRSLQNAEERKYPVIVIRGSGGAFSSGGDIGEFKHIDREKMYAGMELLNKNIIMLRKLDAIVIAVLEGPVAGAAVGLSLACDISVAVKNAFMNIGFRRLGLSVDGAGSILLPRLIGAKRSNELFFLARNLNMDEASRLGLVNFVWETDGFEERLEKMIEEIMKLPFEPIKHFKALMNLAVFTGLEEQLKLEQDANCELFTASSFKARLNALFSK